MYVKNLEILSPELSEVQMGERRVKEPGQADRLAGIRVVSGSLFQAN